MAVSAQRLKSGQALNHPIVNEPDNYGGDQNLRCVIEPVPEPAPVDSDYGTSVSVRCDLRGDQPVSVSHARCRVIVTLRILA